MNNHSYFTNSSERASDDAPAHSGRSDVRESSRELVSSRDDEAVAEDDEIDDDALHLDD